MTTGGGFRRETGRSVAGSAGSVTLTNRRIPVADLAVHDGDSDRLMGVDHGTF
jgi:hypothetical protein